MFKFYNCLQLNPFQWKLKKVLASFGPFYRKEKKYPLPPSALVWKTEGGRVLSSFKQSDENLQKNSISTGKGRITIRPSFARNFKYVMKCKYAKSEKLYGS